MSSKKTGILKPAMVQSLRHCYAAYLLEAVTDIHIILELISYGSRITENYSYVSARTIAGRYPQLNG